MKHLAVVDTNVIVGAILSSHDDSAVVKVFQKIINLEIVPLYNEEIIKEYREVLLRRKFSLNPDYVDYIVTMMILNGIMVNAKSSGLQLIDMKDLPFYEVVLEKQKEGAYLITGNKKHFPNNPIVVTAAEFLKIIESN